MKNNGYCIWDPSREKWWNPSGMGYTSDIEKAGVYSKERAKKICDDPFANELMFLKSNLIYSKILLNKVKHGYFDPKSKYGFKT